MNPIFGDYGHDSWDGSITLLLQGYAVHVGKWTTVWWCSGFVLDNPAKPFNCWLDCLEVPYTQNITVWRQKLWELEYHTQQKIKNHALCLKCEAKVCIIWVCLNHVQGDPNMMAKHLLKDQKPKQMKLIIYTMSLFVSLSVEGE